MGRHDLYIAVPSFFRCPISLDVMKSPVSLCTGVTYDRSSIQRWLDNGNNTCPATMQVLQTKDFVPNHTLQRLIQIWSDSVQTRSPTSSDDSPSYSSLTQEQARDLIEQVKINANKDDDEQYLGKISKLAPFAENSDENRKFLASLDGFLPFLVEVLGKHSENLRHAEKVVQICSKVVDEHKDKDHLAKLMIDEGCLSSMLLVLQRGSLDSRIASAKVLESIALEVETKIVIAEHSDVLSELLRLVGSESDPSAIEAGMSCLVCLATPRRIRLRIVRLGAVKVFGKLLSDSDLSVSVVEKVLRMLEMVSLCKEGRGIICEDEVCVPAIVKKVLKVSSVATEHAVTILWSLCCLFRDPKVQGAVTKSNGLAKVLLLMQSNCSPAVRQMSGDLLKVFRVDSKCCLSSYDTKTTHIMPF